MDYKNYIYRLHFEGDDRSYIGSTKSARARLRTHMWDLLRKKHTNNILQLAFNKKDISLFTWEIIEKDIDSKLLLKRENYYINLYNSMTNGYNQTIITTALNKYHGVKLFEPKDGVYDFSIINTFTKKHKVELRLIEVSTYKKYPKAHFSKYFWDNIDEENMNKLLTSGTSYLSHHINSPFRNVICCIDNTRVFEFLESQDKKSLKDLYVRVKRFYGENKHKVTDVLVLSALNPFMLEYTLLKDRIDEYRVAKLFKLLEIQKHLGEKIVLHLPQYLYDSYKRVLMPKQDP